MGGKRDNKGMGKGIIEGWGEEDWSKRGVEKEK